MGFPWHGRASGSFCFVPLMAVAAWQAWALPGGTLISAEVCGRCHRDILDAWKASIHAKSLEDTVFQDCLEQAQRQFGNAVQSRCLACHAPTVAFTGDTTLENKVSWEGVTCDFCHSISQVDLRNLERPYRLQVGSAKFGPLKDAFAHGHPVAFSNIHTDAIVCAGCHDARNAGGLMVLSSYSEWQGSSFAADRATCLSCHMTPVKGRVVDPKVLRLKDARVNLHQMPGGHSVDQLNKALWARIAAQKSGAQLEVKVIVRNRGAGHMVPTGSPLRRLVLSVEVYTSLGRRLTAERIYQRVIADEKGALLSDEPSVWIRGARVASDNRLKPNEERTEIFRFDLSGAQATRAQAHFSYLYSPMAAQAGRVPFLTLSAVINP